MPSESSYPSALPVQTQINRDAMKPGRQGGFFSESMDFLIDLQKNVLNNVQALFPVQGDAIGDAEEFALISSDQSPKSVFLARLQ